MILEQSVKSAAANIEASGTGIPLLPKVNQRDTVIPKETKFAQERLFDTSGPAQQAPQAAALAATASAIKSLNLPANTAVQEAFSIVQEAALKPTDLAGSIRDSPGSFGAKTKPAAVTTPKPELKDGPKYLLHILLKPIKAPNATSSIALVGNIPELGAWDASDAVVLAKRGEDTWEAVVELDSPSGSADYKYAIVDEKDGQVQWENGDNRKLTWWVSLVKLRGWYRHIS